MTIDYTYQPCGVSPPRTARAPIRIIERLPPGALGYWEPAPSAPTAYESEVQRLLDRVFATRVGQCVWTELCDHWQHDRGVVITPYHADPTRSLASDTYHPPRSDAERRAAPTLTGAACGRAPVTTSDLRGFRNPALCRGEVPRGGVVYFHPMHPPPPSSAANAIPRDPAHVVFHEVVHVHNRGMAGWRAGEESQLVFSDRREYAGLDDYFVIMVTNYLRAEEGAPLRRDHNGYHHMDEDAAGHPERWIANPATGTGACVSGTVTNRDLVNLFIRMHTRLAQCLTGVASSSFDPIGQAGTTPSAASGP